MAVSEFDAAWQSLAGTFEEVFGKTFVYRTLEGKTFDITASVVYHRQTAQRDHDVAMTTWQGHVFTMNRGGLTTNGIEYPRNGEEICEQIDAENWYVYRITAPPKGKTYQSSDPEDFQLDVYAVEVGQRNYA